MTGKQGLIQGAWQAVALCAALLAGMPARAQCKLQALALPVQLVNQRPVVTVKLDGVDVRMLVDTGGFFSMLTEATATQLALERLPLPHGFTVRGYAGPIEASRATVKQVVLQGLPLSNIEFLVGLNELGSGIGGLLGRNFLSLTDMEFDLAHGMVRMIFPKGDCDQTHRAYWAGDAPVIEAPLEVSTWQAVPPIRVQTQINGKTVLAMLDTGAPYTALGYRAARRAGVKPEDMTPLGSVGGAGQGRVRSWTALIESFELGGEKIANNRLMIDDVARDGQDMLIGLDYFLSHRIYVSWKQKRFYATWNGGPVFARSWDASTGDQAHAAAPTPVAPDDADALARRGQASAARGDTTRALQDLTRAAELAPANAAHFEARAAVHIAMRSARLALADLDTALGLDAGLHAARLQRARLRQATGDPAGAQADLAELDRRLPASAQLRADMADAHADQQRLPEALRQWAQWMDTHPNDGGLPGVLNARCWLRARLGVDLDLALDDCRRAVRLASRETAYHDSLGWTLLRLNDAARAKKAFDTAIELQPKAAWSLYGRALVLLRQGQPEAAARDLAAARQQRPEIDAEVKRAGFPVPDELPAAGA